MKEKQSDQHEPVAPVVADMLDQACKSYAEFWSCLSVKPSTDEDDRDVAERVRRGGAKVATYLAYVSRLVEGSVIDLDGRPFPPPSKVLKALRDLQDSYTLMASIESYDDLLNQPLVPWDEIRAALDEPEAREWMKTALAAY